MPPTQIDGSHGEGGGQIIRTSVSLSALTGQPVEIANIRAARPRPGLQPQHLMAVRAAAALCDARLRGDAIHSTWLSFEPQGVPRSGEYEFDIGTAGASPLVIQTVLAPLAWGSASGNQSSRVSVTGGTHVPHAPPAEYVEAVYVPALRRAGLQGRVTTLALGFYPRGGGRVELTLPSVSPPYPLRLVERGKLRSLRAYVAASQLPAHVAERGEAAVRAAMKAIGRPVTVERRDLPSNGPGAAVVLAAECENGFAGFTGIGARGKPMEQVAEQPCAAFLQWWKSGAACDEHLADQLVLPMALTPGESQWTTPVVTEHLRTVLWVAQQFLPISFTIDEPPGAPAVVSVRRE